MYYIILIKAVFDLPENLSGGMTGSMNTVLLSNVFWSGSGFQDLPQCVAWT